MENGVLESTIPNYVIWLLHDVRPSEKSSLGGKGFNLALLKNQSFPVPDGFVLTTSAYRRFLIQNGIDSSLEKIIANGGKSSAGSESIAINEIFLNAKIPQDILDVLKANYEKLISPTFTTSLVAVRSSSEAEDHPKRSFAGQYETVLGIRTFNQLVSAILKVWVSLWSSHSIGYRSQMDSGPSPNLPSMAVIVQKLVEPDASGVMFTANPLSGNNNELVINATYGLGELLVSGEVEPDLIIVSKEDPSNVKEKKIGKKQYKLVASNQTGMLEKKETTHDERTRLCLTDKQTRNLVDLGKQIELFYSTPQDIEFAIQQETIHILQARPITTEIGRQPSKLPSSNEVVYTRGNLKELMPEVATPLSLTALEFLLDRSTEKLLRYHNSKNLKATRAFFGRLYVNLSGIVETGYKAFGFAPEYVLETFGGPDYKGFNLPKLSTQEKIQARWRTLRVVLRNRNLPTRIQNMFAEVISTKKDYDEQRLSSLSQSELSSLYKRFRAFEEEAILLHIRVGTSATSYYGFLKGFFKNWLPERDLPLLSDLIGGLSGMIVFEENRRLWLLSEEAKKDPQVYARFLNRSQTEISKDLISPEYVRNSNFGKQLNEFLLDYGFTPYREGDFLLPTWKEDCTPLLLTVKANIESAVPDPAEKLEQQETRRKQARHEIMHDLIKGIWAKLFPYRRKIVSIALNNFTKFTVLREDSKVYLLIVLSEFRSLALEYGKRLKSQMILDDPKDIFFLTITELDSAFEGKLIVENKIRSIIESRKREFKENSQRVLPDIVVGEPRGEALDDYLSRTLSTKVSDKTVGLGISPGVARGIIAVVASPFELKRVERGNIVVAPFSDPSWTPVFALAGAMILEIGGLLSHGAIIARELGIPAVANVENATKIFRDGMRVEVNGTTGEINVANS